MRVLRPVSVAITPADSGRDFHGIRDQLRVPGIAKLCVCEGLWNFALASLRTFVVLFFVMGLDRSSSFVSAVIFPLVAVGIAVAAPTAGWFSDRFGAIRVLLGPARLRRDDGGARLHHLAGWSPPSRWSPPGPPS